MAKQIFVVRFHYVLFVDCQELRCFFQISHSWESACPRVTPEKLGQFNVWKDRNVHSDDLVWMLVCLVAASCVRVTNTQVQYTRLEPQRRRMLLMQVRLVCE